MQYTMKTIGKHSHNKDVSGYRDSYVIANLTASSSMESIYESF